MKRVPAALLSGERFMQLVATMGKLLAELAAFAAASVANVSPMRLGAIIYFVPFFFVFNPALLLQGTYFRHLDALATAVHE